MLEEKKQVDVVEYSGRKASRTGSEKRRKAILEAALRIVVKDGVRGVRHRAVAKEAEVPLSATTYYFKDISDLIADTFVLFAEAAMTGTMETLKLKVMDYLRHTTPEKMATPAGKQEVISVVSRFVATHILEELHGRREHLMAQQAFMLEAMRDNRLSQLALTYKEKLQEGLVGIFAQLGSQSANDDAWILLNSIIQFENENLLRDIAEVDILAIESRVARLLTALVG